MLEFPEVREPEPGFRVRRMSLAEYAEFIYACLLRNPNITSDSCLTLRTGEAKMERFRIRQSPGDSSRGVPSAP